MANLLVQMQARRAIAGISRPMVQLSKIEPVAHKPFVATYDMSAQYMGQLRNAKQFYYGFTVPLPVPFHPATLRPSQWAITRALHRFKNYASSGSWSFAVVLTSLKAGSADFLAQKYVEKRDEIDMKRLAVFTAFGAIYSGTMNHFLYTKYYPIWFRGNNVGSAIRMNFTDNFINTPFLFFPTLYLLKEKIIGGGSVWDAFAKYRAEWYEGCKTAWGIWIPMHVITFGVVPTSLRTPFTTVISFFYYCSVSLQQARFDERRKLLEADVENELKKQN
mmetsp:Transcript_2749/g.3218  ORF Transcript_2749/g.3218 Transcript_2749/m.3218 type:complete len:276 (+) Transcript_2749:306-1133(+)